ncbi:MAG: hypothetical protein M1812_007247 [Candelaria pacifica]|nr:MAG: hypothetical protein M1812_007247 [Candelaria pacifica]
MPVQSQRESQISDNRKEGHEGGRDGDTPSDTIGPDREAFRQAMDRGDRDEAIRILREKGLFRPRRVRDNFEPNTYEDEESYHDPDESGEAVDNPGDCGGYDPVQPATGNERVGRSNTALCNLTSYAEYDVHYSPGPPTNSKVELERMKKQAYEGVYLALYRNAWEAGNLATANFFAKKLSLPQMDPSQAVEYEASEDAPYHDPDEPGEIPDNPEDYGDNKPGPPYDDDLESQTEEYLAAYDKAEEIGDLETANFLAKKHLSPGYYEAYHPEYIAAYQKAWNEGDIETAKTFAEKMGLPMCRVNIDADKNAEGKS